MEKPSVGLKLLTYRDEDAMVSAIIAPSGSLHYLTALQKGFDQAIVTEVLPFAAFRLNVRL